MAESLLRVIEPVGSARGYAIKDFLARNQVPFDTHAVGSAGSVVVELTGGDVLFEPSLIELATALGLTDAAGDDDCDLVVVGGGPAGLAAAVYSACEGLRVVIVEDDAPGGQAGSTSRIENYLGFPAGLSGGDLAQRALAQARRFGVRWMSARRAVALRRDGDRWAVDSDDGSTARGTAVLVATGMRWRPLDVPGAEELRDIGVYYGASTPVAVQTAGSAAFVLGAGNSAGQAALYLAEHGVRVALLVRGPTLDGSPMSRYLVRRIEESDLVDVRVHTEVAAVTGTGKMSGIVLRDSRTGETTTEDATALYVLIGMTPCTEWLAEQSTVDTRGYLVTGTDLLRIDGAWSADRDPLLTETSLPGVFAAGDVRSGTVKRIGSAIGQGAVASQAVLEYLRDAAVRRIPEQGGVSSFDLLDSDRDGRIGAADLAAFGERLVTAFDEPPDTERARRVHDACGEFWTVLSRFGANGVDRAAFTGALDELAALNAFAPLADAVLGLSDTDADGSLTLHEFQRLLGALGTPADAAAATFGLLDHDRTGQLDTTRLAAGGLLLGQV